MNFNIVMGDFHILQSYLSYRLYCENNISYNYIEKIECKQWYAQMADVMNIFSTESVMRKIILQLWIKKKDSSSVMHEFHISWTCYYQWTTYL